MHGLHQLGQGWLGIAACHSAGFTSTNWFWIWCVQLEASRQGAGSVVVESPGAGLYRAVLCAARECAGVATPNLVGGQKLHRAARDAARAQRAAGRVAEHHLHLVPPGAAAALRKRLGGGAGACGL